MLLKKATFYLAVAGTAATIAMVVHVHGQSPITPPPIEPSPRPYEVSVAASGIIEALSENVAIGVPEASLVTKVHVKVWDSIQEGQPLFTLDDRELRAQLTVNEANATVAEATLRRLQDQLARLKGVNELIFNDAELNSFETQAVEANQDLKRAVARVTEARALARVSKSELYPSISASGAYSRNRLSENGANTPQHNLEFDDFSGSFDLSYELDVWGRVRRSVEAANADASVVATDLQVVLLTLTADVARNYQLLRSLDNEKVVIEATIALRRDAVRLQETRNQAGLINEVDVTRAWTELANVEAELHATTRNRAQVEHALAVLCGQPPANFSVAAKASSVAPPEVPAGLPSELLQRRPDIVEAEHSLEAASARIGVAKAAFFPTIKLTSTAGLASADLGMLVDWPSRFASVGPSISVPIFQGGRNRANLKATEARYEQSVASYRGSILNAFREVEDSLSDLSTLASQGEAVNRALVSASDTATLANERYQQGLSSYLDVVDAQRAALQADRQDAQLRGQRAISTILLAKALGGGWESSHSPQRLSSN